MEEADIRTIIDHIKKMSRVIHDMRVSLSEMEDSLNDQISRVINKQVIVITVWEHLGRHSKYKKFHVWKGSGAVGSISVHQSIGDKSGYHLQVIEEEMKIFNSLSKKDFVKECEYKDFCKLKSLAKRYMKEEERLIR